jgi:hypothetical protein
MFIDEMTHDEQNKILLFLSQNKMTIVSDILRGR